MSQLKSAYWKLFLKPVCHEGLISKINEEFIKLHEVKTDNPIKNWAKKA